MKTELADYHVLTAEMEDLPKMKSRLKFCPQPRMWGIRRLAICREALKRAVECRTYERSLAMLLTAFEIEDISRRSPLMS